MLYKLHVRLHKLTTKVASDSVCFSCHSASLTPKTMVRWWQSWHGSLLTSCSSFEFCVENEETNGWNKNIGTPHFLLTSSKALKCFWKIYNFENNNITIVKKICRCIMLNHILNVVQKKIYLPALHSSGFWKGEIFEHCLKL